MIDFFLENLFINADDGAYDIYLEEGQEKVKSKKCRHKVVDLVTWLEAWNNYEHFMASYHGLEVYFSICDYKNLVLDWNRKYYWSSIYAFDKMVLAIVPQQS